MLGYDFNHKLHRCERGVVMVFFAILLPLLFGFMGLSLDAGLAYVEKGKAQDIADAAALAGAAHLSDEDRDTTVKDAVKAYVEANGITLGDNDLVKKADDSAWNTKETLATGKDSIVAWGIVTVTKDGETKDRVRVRITKRVPVVFLSMVDGIADNIVVSAKAAAEGGGEEEERIREAASRLASLLKDGGEGELLEYCVGLEKWDRDALSGLMDETVQQLRDGLLRGDAPGRSLRLISHIQLLKEALSFHVGAGHIAGWLCAGAFAHV